MVSIADMFRTRDEIDSEIAEVSATLERLRVERVGVDALLNRLGLNDRPSPSRQSGPRVGATTGTGNTEVVRSVLAEHPHGLDLRAIESAVADSGHELNGEQVRSAVTYLRRRGLAVRVERGVWRLVGPDDLVPSNTPTDTESPVGPGLSVVPSSTSQVGDGPTGMLAASE